MLRSRLALSASLLVALCGCDSELPSPEAQPPTRPPGAWAEDLTAPLDTPLADTGGDDLGDTTADTDTAPADLDTDGDQDGLDDADTGPDPCPPGVLGTTAACAVASCLELAVRDPAAPSGIYFATVMNSDVPAQVFCEMTQAGGGWTSLVRFNAAVDTACPPGWTSNASPDVCVRPADGPGQSPVLYTSGVVAWSEIRGFVTALKFSTTDAFVSDTATSPDEVYTDGVSLVLQSSSTQHLWTYAAGWQHPLVDQPYNCPCAGGTQPPAFVGGHYACEAPAAVDDSGQWREDNPMWSGPGVGVHCDVRGEVSWFERHLEAPTTGTIEARIVVDEDRVNEDVGIAAMSLFVREAERCEGATAGADEDHDGLIDEPGCGTMNPATSCLQIRDASGFAASGVYWIQPDSSFPVRVYCDMETAGGGWTLAAVCRQGSTGCHDPNAVGSPDSPWHATTAKLADRDIIRLLASGEQTTLGLWRTGVRSDVADSYDAVSAVVNEIDMPSDWSSAPCSTPLGATWTMRDTVVFDDLSVDPATLIDETLAKTALPVVAGAGACGCAPGGWSNQLADSCLAGWGTRDENGPSALHNGATPEYRADLQLWVR